MKKIDDLRELFVEQLREQYDAERRKLAFLPELRSFCKDPELQHLVDHHIGTIKRQMEGLDLIFEMIGRTYRGEINKAMEGLILEGRELAGRCKEEVTRDMGMISTLSQLNHYNISAYTSLFIYSKRLEEIEVSVLLKETLEEKKSFDQELYQLAHSLSEHALDFSHGNKAYPS